MSTGFYRELRDDQPRRRMTPQEINEMMAQYYGKDKPVTQDDTAIERAKDFVRETRIYDGFPEVEPGGFRVISYTQQGDDWEVVLSVGRERHFYTVARTGSTGETRLNTYAKVASQTFKRTL